MTVATRHRAIALEWPLIWMNVAEGRDGSLYESGEQLQPITYLQLSRQS